MSLFEDETGSWMVFWHRKTEDGGGTGRWRYSCKTVDLDGKVLLVETNRRTGKLVERRVTPELFLKKSYDEKGDECGYEIIWHDNGYPDEKLIEEEVLQPRLGSEEFVSDTSLFYAATKSTITYIE